MTERTKGVVGRLSVASGLAVPATDRAIAVF